MRAEDFVGLTDVDLFDAESVECIRRNDDETLCGGGRGTSPTIGGVSALADGTTPTALLLEADRRPYRAKAEGRNRVVAG